MFGPILFSIFLSDLFLILCDKDISIYADDNTIYKEHGNIKNILVSLQVPAARLFKWFPASYMKGNTYKCPLLMSKYGSRKIHIDKLIDC